MSTKKSSTPKSPKSSPTPSACYCATVGLEGAPCPVCGKAGGFGRGSRDLGPATKLTRASLRTMGAPGKYTAPAVQPAAKPAPVPVAKPAPRVVATVTVPAANPGPAISEAARTVAADEMYRRKGVEATESARRAHLALREAYASKRYNEALAILIGLAGGPSADSRLHQLAAIDAWGAAHGSLTPAHLKQRRVIGEACVAALGYNPATHDAPGVKAGALFHAAPPKAEETDGECMVHDPGCEAGHDAVTGFPLGAGLPVVQAGPVRKFQRPTPPPFDASQRLLEAPPGPLVSGDWAGLAKRVRRGEISEAEAKAFGELWTGGKAN